jgi:endo-beta-N-acetylglucosaminidase D
MKRLTLIIVSGVIGLALLIGATHDATATTSGQPGDGVPCYYNLYTCSYQDSMAYWSGCDPQYSQGLIPTASAKVICSTYHDQ